MCSKVVVRKPLMPSHTEHSTQEINLDRNKIDLRRPCSRLLPRPLSLPSSFKLLKIFHSTRANACTVEDRSKLMGQCSDEKVDMPFIKALEDEIYRTKAELAMQSHRAKSLHTDRCLCCVKKADDSPTPSNPVSLRRRVSNDYSRQHGVRLDENREPQAVVVINANEGLLKDIVANPAPDVCHRRSGLKWPFISRPKSIAGKSRVGRKSWLWKPKTKTKANRRKSYSDMVDKVPAKSKEGQKRWKWLNAIHIGRRYHAHTKPNEPTKDIDDDATQHKRVDSDNSRHAAHSESLRNHGRSSSFRTKRHSAGSTTSSTNVVKAWVYRRRFLNKYKKNMYSLAFSIKKCTIIIKT